MTNPSFVDRMKDAAYERTVEQQDERRRVADIVLGTDTRRIRSRRVVEIVKLGSDYLVEVGEGGDEATAWTTVVGDRATSWMHHTQEEAVLHLIARRYDPSESASHGAAFYAGRVLGLPAAKE